MSRHFDIIDVHDEVIKDYDFRQISKLQEYDEEEKEFFFYHKDHLGSSTQISDRDANIIHHPEKFVSKSFRETIETTNSGLVWMSFICHYSHNFSNYESRLNIEYMHFDKFNLPPSGEQFSEQRDSWSTPYKFNSKELDAETGLYYYGARYYTPEIGIWLSVDPLSDKYPSMSAFMYCAGNPVMLVDPDGREVEFSSFTDRICVAIMRVTNSDFRNSFNTLKKSEETYVFNGSSDESRQQELTTDGDKLFINYKFNSSKSQGTNWANNMKHETEHAMQFEHGEVGFELFDTGGPLGGDGVYYPNNEWKAVSFDLDDEIKARDKGYSGTTLNPQRDNIKNQWNDYRTKIDDKKQVLRNTGYRGEVPVNNPNHDKVKTSHQFMLPYRPRN